MDRWLIQQVIDLDAGKVTTGQQYGHPLMMQGDALGHVWRIQVRKGGKAVDLTGAAVTGSFVRADGYTVLIGGDITATGTVEVVLHPSCYVVPGMLFGFVKVALGDMVMPLSQLYFNVQRGATDMIVDPSNKIPSVEQLLQLAAQVEALTAALEAAETIRVVAENTRVANEETRETNEEGRIAAESERATNEAARGTAETQRSSKEQLREQAESGRVTAEGQRANTESLRLDAERQRQAQEAERQTNTQGAIGRADSAATRANTAAQAAEDVVDDVAGAALDVAMQAWPREVIDPQHPLSTAAGSHMGVVVDEDCTVLHAGSKNINTSPMELGRLASDGGLVADNNCVRSADYVPILPGVTYTVSNDKGFAINVYQYDSQYAFIATDGTNTPPYTFTAALNAAYIKVRSASGIGQNDTSVIYQVEIGSVATGIVESAGAEVITLQAAVPRTIAAYGNDRLTASNGVLRVRYNPGAEQNQRDTFVHAEEAGEQLVTATGAVPHKGLGVAVDVVAGQETREQGKNYADPADIQIGTLSGTTGLPIDNNNLIRTGYVPVYSGGDGMGAIQGLPENFVLIALRVYDASKAFMPGANIADGKYIRIVYGVSGAQTPVTDDELAYMRANYQYELASTPTPYEPYTPAMPSPEAPSPIKGTELVEVGHGNHNLQYSVLELGTINATTGENVYYLDCVRTKDYVRIGGGTQITISCDLGYSAICYWYDKDKAYIGNNDLGATPASVVVPVGAAYMRMRSNASLNQNSINALYQIEAGATATTIIPHQSHTTTYAPDKALYGLPGAPDTVDFGAGVETRKTKRNTYTGAADENWGMYTAANGTYFTIALPDRCYFDNDFTQMRCTMAPTGAPPKLPCAYITSTGKTLVIYPDVASLDSVDAFKALLASSPMDVVYQLATPITTPITTDTIPAYGGTEHVWCEDATAVRVGYALTEQGAYDKQQAQINALQSLLTGG